MRLAQKWGTIMLRSIVLLSVMVGLQAPAFAAQGIRGGVANISATDAAVLGTTAWLGCRVYSVSGSETGINLNTAVTIPACGNARCRIANYSTLGGYGNPGGYLCNSENTAAYNGDADNQIFYQLVDDEIFAGTLGHAAFFAVQGVLASSTFGNPGDFRQAGCPGTTVGNCFLRADATNSRQTPILNVAYGYQGPHELGSIGGLSPVPVVRLALGSAVCPAGHVRLTWDEPETYAAAMRDGVPSPVQGVRVWKSVNTCAHPPSGDVVAGGWVPIGFFPLGSGAEGTCDPLTADVRYALTVVVKGPSSGATQIETGIVDGAGFVGAASLCIAAGPTAARIVSLAARYAGRGSVNISFTTGSEAGVIGFQVQRASSPAGPWTPVTGLIPTKGDGSEYMATDRVRAALGRVLYYSVRVVMNDGSTVESGTSAVSLPAARKKLSPGS